MKQHVVRLTAKNIKCLKEVAIDFDGEIHEIRGDTGQGKTSILDSIESAIRGIDPAMVRRGADKAELELVLTDAIIRRIRNTDGKDTLKVTDPAGKKIDKGAAFLSAICGQTAFNPLYWVQLGAGDADGKTKRLRQQRDMLLNAVPMTLTRDAVAELLKQHGIDADLPDIDYTAHALTVAEKLREHYYSERTGQNKVVDNADAKLRNMPKPDKPAPKSTWPECQRSVDVAESALRTARSAAEKRETLQARADALRAEIGDADVDVDALDAAVDSARKAMVAAQTEVETLEQKLREARERHATLTGEYNEAVDRKANAQSVAARKHDIAAIERDIAAIEQPDMVALQAAYDTAVTALEAKRLDMARQAAAEEARKARAESERLTALVELFRNDLPQRLIADSNLPVDGLGVDGDSVTINGVPIHQLGTSEQIRVGVMVAAALNPQCGFVLVDGAESLGKKDRAALAKAAHDKGIQLILSFVDPDATPADNVTVMADGEQVKGDDDAGSNK